MTQNILTLGQSLNDVDLASFYGASDSGKCVVTISNGSGEVTMTGNCKGVTVKEQ
ncbi:MAG TPA: hypothetical protein K8V32_10045 [Enteractinococcus helveticum]|uniref:Uncharacterized protein n=1 Tax=Enteractinococcus helveticum TaxID=1837282 RepID=A0A921K8D4_9MICC|nr:hypothetical protein [Enteractinococcus helveticum]HJF15126.1 hypothetical protein [Enteractinococcus helveticum]